MINSSKESVAPFELKDIRQRMVRIYKGACSAIQNPAIADSYKTKATETDLYIKITASPNFTVQDLRQFRALADRLGQQEQTRFPKNSLPGFFREINSACEAMPTAARRKFATPSFPRSNK